MRSRLPHTQRPASGPRSRDSLDHLTPEVYEDLRAIARRQLAMRHVLVDRAKARLSRRRGSGHRQVTLDDERVPAEAQAEVVDCRFLGGVNEDEVADALGVTRCTVQRDWAKARQLLRRAMEP